MSLVLMGPFDFTQEGKKGILVVIDFLTRYSVVRALPRKPAVVAARSISYIFAEFGTLQTGFH